MSYLDEKGYAELFGKLLRNVGNVCLIGESGCGKTQLVHHYCKTNNILLFEISLTAETTRAELLASPSPTGDSGELRQGIVMQWLDTNPARVANEDGRLYDGVLCYWDGFNYASPGITALLESLADFRGMVRISETGEVRRRTDRHYLVISMNPSEKSAYGGTFQMNAALRRRFETIRMGWLDPAAETSLLVDRTGVSFGFARAVVEFANRTREAYRSGRLSTVLTTGNLLNYAKLYKDGMDEETIVRIASNQFREEEATSVRELWHGAR